MQSHLIISIALAFAAALLFGLLAHRLRLSPILGYLLAGVILGPGTPGLFVDPNLAAELAELGVVLLMFGVGLHFNLRELLAVQSIAVPGALLQSLITAALAAAIALAFGWSLGAALVFGLALSVASTVVLLRVVMDENLLLTVPGRVAVGWLIVEDIFTVIAIVALPAASRAANASGGMFGALGFALLKLALMAALILFGGGKVVPWLFAHVARTRSSELFTLTVLAVALGIATVAATLFGASMALGAFLAGMIVGQSEVHHQAAADALPLRDAFAVLFFVSVGMFFDPKFLLQSPLLILATFFIVVICKPVVALLVVALLRHPLRTALTVALGMGQIGEFSFILADIAHPLGLFPADARGALVAAAMFSIALNPILFRKFDLIEKWLRAKPKLARLFSDAHQAIELPAPSHPEPGAIIIGYGPSGKTLTSILTRFGVSPTVIDLNLDTVKKIKAQGISAIYGDAGRREILIAAGIEHASFLLVTLPDLTSRIPVIATARLLNPKIAIITRARYLAEHAMLEDSGADDVAYEEAEVAVTLADSILRRLNVDPIEIAREAARIRSELSARIT